jgi:subtilisin family serine protease
MVRPDHPARRPRRFEPLESRLAPASLPLAPLSYASPFEMGPLSGTGPDSAAVAAASSYRPADLTALHQRFGLTGLGQTVALIDSGIAYDHVALGGGFGPGYRVVGGWDFAENDADPYDDAPAGFHGTHVAGIVAAQDPRRSGVAPGVDLVALRVFDDRGRSSLEWVRQALEWVHAHRTAFPFPITIVNLSLGAAWNGTSPPVWGTLEADLKRLVEDGMVITVAAGNFFQVYAAPGLAYPAASPWVVPVASVGPDGTLSRFSQRDARVLAAPGEQIVSTLPDAFYGADGVKNDWGAASGTSMAAPYVAGAAALVRQAMQQLDVQAVAPEALVQWLHSTADTLVDPATALRYDRLNLERALETLVGVDEDGSTVEAAQDLGPLATEVRLTGTFQTATDRDYFRFTAAASGQVELNLTAPTTVGAAWLSPEGRPDARPRLTLPVEAGQTYVVGVTSAAGTIGRYHLTLALRPDPAPPPAVDLGTITQLWQPDVSLSQGQAAFQLVPSQTGRLTVELLPATAAPAAATLRLSDTAGLVASTHGMLSASAGQKATATKSALRLDLDVVAGQSYLVQMESSAARVGLRLTNLVTFQDGQVLATGTAGADRFVYQGGADGWLEINAVRYEVGRAARVVIEASGGDDRLQVLGGAESERIVLAPGVATCRSSSRELVARGMREVRVLAQAEDEVRLFDSPASDLVLASPRGVALVMPQAELAAEGAGRYEVVAQAGGNDTVRLVDSPGDDELRAGPRQATLVAGGVTLHVRGFAQTVVTATAGGNDRATLEGFASRDWRSTAPRSVALQGAGYGLRLSGIELVQMAGGQHVLRLALPADIPQDASPTSHAWLLCHSECHSELLVGDGCGSAIQPAADAAGDPVHPPVAPSDPAARLAPLGALGDTTLKARLRRLEQWLFQLHTGQPQDVDLAAVDFLFQKLGRPAGGS